MIRFSWLKVGLLNVFSIILHRIHYQLMCLCWQLGFTSREFLARQLKHSNIFAEIIGSKNLQVILTFICHKLNSSFKQKLVHDCLIIITKNYKQCKVLKQSLQSIIFSTPKMQSFTFTKTVLKFLSKLIYSNHS